MFFFAYAYVCSMSENCKSLVEQDKCNIVIQSNLDYSKCKGPQESFQIIGSSNDRKRESSDIFGKARMLS